MPRHDDGEYQEPIIEAPSPGAVRAIRAMESLSSGLTEHQEVLGETIDATDELAEKLDELSEQVEELSKLMAEFSAKLDSIAAIGSVLKALKRT